MNDSDRYVPPPPPYELSLQQKVGEGIQGIEASKTCPFQLEAGEASKGQTDCKDSKAFDQKAFPEAAVYPLRIQKRSAKPDDPPPRPHRPLPPPPRPVHAHRLNLPGPEQGIKMKCILESKEALWQQDRVAEIPPPPPFSDIARPSEDLSYLQSMHSSTSYPSNTTHRSPHNQPPRQRYHDNTPPPSPYYPEHQVETSYSGRFQSGSRNSSQPRNLGMHLAFDPSVAYSGSQADSWGSEPPRGVNAASLYSSSVSSHLHPGAPPGSRQSYVPSSSISHTEASRLDKADMRSLQSRYSVVVDPAASTASFSYGPRPMSIHDYDQRWATSESDIHREVYRGRP